MHSPKSNKQSINKNLRKFKSKKINKLLAIKTTSKETSQGLTNDLGKINEKTVLFTFIYIFV
jgi:hypothetical protein